MWKQFSSNFTHLILFYIVQNLNFLVLLGKLYITQFSYLFSQLNIFF